MTHATHHQPRWPPRLTINSQNLCPFTGDDEDTGDGEDRGEDEDMGDNELR